MGQIKHPQSFMVTLLQRFIMTDKAQKKPTLRPTSRHQKRVVNRRIIQRGLIAQISTALFQPVAFFETLAPMRQTRQWLWVGFIILALVGLSAVQQKASVQTTTPTEVTAPIAPVGDPFSSGGDFGTSPPIDTTPNPISDLTQTTNNWTIALIEATRLIVMWFGLSIMLMVVPMFKGRPPQMGENIQVAIYASLPLGIMATLQLIFMAAGGRIGAAGLSGLVDELPIYQTADPFLQSIMLSAASQTTIFMMWSLLMIYFGGRFLLRGDRIMVILVIVAWVIVLVIMPVATGAIRAEPADTLETPSDMTMPDMDDFSDMPPSDVEDVMNPFDDMSMGDMLFDITPAVEFTPDTDATPEGFEP